MIRRGQGLPRARPEPLSEAVDAKDIPGAEMSSRSLDFLAGDLRPGCGLVVGGAGFQAAGQDADEAVGQVAERGAVDGAGSPVGVITGTGSLGGVQGGAW